MPHQGLTGSRIRARRMELGLRQAALAAQVGISPAYLNLIEHNRRRIGGALLVALARELSVEPSSLTEGAEAALLADLRAAATAQEDSRAELDRAEEFAGRFPGWAGLVASQRQRIERLERTVAALTDRLTYDPQLAASVHEVLSVATAIRATADILNEPGDIEPEWQARFHRNLHEDGRRLAEGAQALVAYLDAADSDGREAELVLPQEELESWLQARGYFIPELEAGSNDDAENLLSATSELNGAPTTAALARSWFKRYRDDAGRLPLHRLAEAVAQHGLAPARIAAAMGADLALVLRRLAVMSGAPDLAAGLPPVGLVMCDSSGTLTFRKPVEGFPLPRFGAACPRWPLFLALARPAQAVEMTVAQSGLSGRTFQTVSISMPQPGASAGPPVFEASMLIVDAPPGDGKAAESPVPVGPGCRICPRTDCDARREPSILTDGF